MIRDKIMDLLSSNCSLGDVLAIRAQQQASASPLGSAMSGGLGDLFGLFGSQQAQANKRPQWPRWGPIPEKASPIPKPVSFIDELRTEIDNWAKLN